MGYPSGLGSARPGPWAGWRLAGRDLVAPTGERIPERRLRGLLWHANASDIRDSVRRRNAKRKAVQQSTLLSQEDQDGRFINTDARSAQRNSRQSYVDLHRYDLKDAQHWIEKQVYLALGTLLLGAATFGVDACPMEGFDAKVLDEELGLRPRGFTGIVLVGLGYSGDGDFNKALPKSRLQTDVVFSDI
ncbi:NAD(P)H-dependent oxidoreductase [Xanthomonas citri pv. punicae]|nr:NAD(P)H-dependent oxidoreductase [Xanthomonas citri pv. punicae]QCZ71762.1 NAD(P)H-dependent oxidoreductase [Xanthomonas citri pv. punicae]